MFNINRCGSRIVTTTSNPAVASCCSSDGGYVYQLEPLSFDDSKRLFLKRAFGTTDLPYPHLEGVLDDILRNCGGLPLAIIIMSSLLVNQHEDEWNRVLSTISCAFANDLSFKSIITRILSLSYFDLPRHLRTCLLYLSIFPEDHEINKKHLINRWIAEGFIPEEQGHSKYEVGECYFNYLINRSFIKPVGAKYGQSKACRVSGIILSFITSKASEENFFTSFHDEHEPILENRVRVRRLFVDNRNKKEAAKLKGLTLSHVRSLTVFGELTGTSLLAFPALRVLDADHGNMSGVEDNGNHQMENIEKLLHLRYLRLRSLYPNFKLTGGIGMLEHLEILDIKDAVILDLPPAITKLHRLSHLYVSHFVRFPDGVIAKMQSLEELSAFGIRVHEQGKSLQEFSQLTKLRTLTVTWDFDWSFCQAEEGLQSNVQNLISSCNLHHLYITNIIIWPSPYPLSLESCCPSTLCSLRKLHITYSFVCKLPNWISSLSNLRELKLYIYCIRSEDVEILGAIPSLVYLKLKTFYGSNGRISIPGYKGFRCLKYFSLVMMSCGTAPEFEAGSMPELEHLKLTFFLHKVECLNGASDFGIQHLSSLNVVEVDINGFLADHKEYNPEDDTEGSNVVRCVTSKIEAAVGTLPNRPACSFQLAKNYGRLGSFHGLTETVSHLSERQILRIACTYSFIVSLWALVYYFYPENSLLFNQITPVFAFLLTTFLCCFKQLNQYNGESVDILLQKMLNSRVKQLVRNNSLLRF